MTRPNRFGHPSILKKAFDFLDHRTFVGRIRGNAFRVGLSLG
jgi:hypothetical protein